MTVWKVLADAIDELRAGRPGSFYLGLAFAKDAGILPTIEKADAADSYLALEILGGVCRRQAIEILNEAATAAREIEESRS